VSDDGLRVRRTNPLAAGEEEIINKAVEERSLYVTPFPMTSTLDGAQSRLTPLTPPLTLARCPGLTTFLSSHGAVRSLRMRKHATSLDFNGTAFVELDSVADAKEFMEKQIVHEGALLVRAGGV